MRTSNRPLLYLSSLFIVFLLALSPASGQVTYDSNAVVVSTDNNASFTEGPFVLPAGDERVIVAFITLGNGQGIDSVKFNGQHFTEMYAVQQSGESLTSALWSFPGVWLLD